MADDIAEMLVKVKGDISDLLAKYEAGKRATSDFESSVDRSSKGIQDDFKGMGKANSDLADLIRKNSRDGETQLQSLQRRSSELRQEMANLRTQFQHTGSADAFAGFKTAETELKKIDAIGKAMGVDFTRSATQTRTGWLGLFDKIAASAKQIGPSLSKGIEDSFTKDISGIGDALSNPIVLAGVVVAAAVWVPIIGSAVGAGITAGVGLGLIGAAALINKNNPILQAAFTSLGTQAGAALRDATATLIKPMEDALDSLANFIAHQGPALNEIFRPLGPAITEIGHDIQRLFETVAPGIARVSEAFTEAFTSPDVQLALSRLANELNAVFVTIGNHPSEIREGFQVLAGTLQLLLGVVNDLIKAAGYLNQTLQVGSDIVTGHWGKAWHDATHGVQETAYGVGVLTDAVVDNAARTKNTTNVINDLGKAMDQLASTVINQLMAAFDTYIDKSLGLSDATITFKNDLANLDSSLKENGKSFDLNTQKGRDNQSMLNTSISDMKLAYDNAVKNGTGIDVATFAYQKQLNQLRANLAAQGLTSAQIAKLTNQYNLLPAQRTTLVKAEGAGAAQSAVDGILGALGKLPKSKSVTIGVHLVGLAAAEAAIAGIKGALGKANSGVVRSGFNQYANSGIAHYANSGATGIYPGVQGGMYRFAESSTGEEALIARNGDRNRALSSLSTAASWFGKDVTLTRNMSVGMDYSRVGGGGGPSVIDNRIYVDGKSLIRTLTPAAQKRGHRNGGTTGLG